MNTMNVDTTYIAPNDEVLNDKLNDAAENNDFVLYEKLVNANLTYVEQFESDWWRELFHGCSYDEISFWINYSDKKWTLGDLTLIKPEYEDLFQKGLARIDISSDDVESVIEYLEEKLEEDSYDVNSKEIIKNRIKQIKSMIPAANV